MKLNLNFLKFCNPINALKQDLTPSHNHRTEIDGLRAIAILSVVLFHAGFSFVKGGFIGVDIFFVLSGFLMTSIILKEKEEGAFTLKKFYERRIRRIIPMLIFTLLLFLPFAYYYLQEKELIFYTRSAVKVLFAISNIFFANNTGGYFDTATDFIPLIHTWTLGVEEQFYVILPLIFIILWKVGKNKLFVLLSYLVIISFFLNFVFKNATHNFYLLHTRFWELGIGSLIAFIKEVKIKNFTLNFGFNGSSKVVNVSAKFVYNLISTLSLLTILLSAHYLHEKINNLQFRMLFPVIATAFLIIFTTKDTITHKILSFKPFRLLGLISYSAYLLHQPIFALVRTSSLEAITKTEWYLWSILTFIIAYFTWKFIENPFRNKEKIKYKHILIAFAFFIALFHFANVITKKNEGFPHRFEMSEELKDEELKGSFRGNLTNNKEPSNTPRIINGVIQDIGRIGDLNEKPKFIVTGNSMVPTIIPIFKEYGMAGEYFSFAGIQSLFVFRKEAEEKMILDRASGVKEVEFAKANLKYILESSIQNVVILINSDCLPYIMEFDIGITLLLQNNKKVYLVYDVVTHPTQAPNIYNFLLKQGKLTNQNLLKYSAKAKDFLSRFEKFDNLLLKHKNNPNLKIVSVRDLVCGKEYCPVGTTQGSYYADFNHFSFHGLKLIEARIKKEILNDIKNSN